MTKLHARTWLLLGALAVPAHVFAEPALISGEPYRKWDTGGVLEINWGESAGWSADLGRYWSPHLKTSLAISTPDEGYHGGEGCSFGRSTMTCTYHTPRPPVAATVAYQFYENAFVHPYVAASLAMSPWHGDRHARHPGGRVQVLFRQRPRVHALGAGRRCGPRRAGVRRGSHRRRRRFLRRRSPCHAE